MTETLPPARKAGMAWEENRRGWEWEHILQSVVSLLTEVPSFFMSQYKIFLSNVQK